MELETAISAPSAFVHYWLHKSTINLQKKTLSPFNRPVHALAEPGSPATRHGAALVLFDAEVLFTNSSDLGFLGNVSAGFGLVAIATKNTQIALAVFPAIYQCYRMIAFPSFTCTYLAPAYRAPSAGSIPHPQPDPWWRRRVRRLPYPFRDRAGRCGMAVPSHFERTFIQCRALALMSRSRSLFSATHWR